MLFHICLVLISKVFSYHLSYYSEGKGLQGNDTHFTGELTEVCNFTSLT